MVGSGERVPATLESVAAAAGVSRATASRAMRGSARVSDETRDRVRAIAQSLSYVPNAAARSLVTRRSDTVAFVVCEPEEKFFSDPFFAAVLKGAHRVVAEHRLQLVFVVVSTDEDRDQLERFASGGHLDAAMFASLHGSEDMPARLAALGLPVVLAGRALDPGAAGLPVVDVDNAQGAGVATQRLVERGRMRDRSRIARRTSPLRRGRRGVGGALGRRRCRPLHARGRARPCRRGPDPARDRVHPRR